MSEVVNRSSNLDFKQLQILSILVDKHCKTSKSNFVYNAKIFRCLAHGEKMVLALKDNGSVAFFNPNELFWFPSPHPNYSRDNMIFTYNELINPQEVKKTYLVVKGQSIKEIPFTDTLKVLGLD